MARILIVDDDEAIRRLVRLNLTDLYEIFDTGKPEEALALALEHKPDAILLDLRMPGYSGFELCKTLTSFSATQLIPVFVISGEGGAKTKDFCRDLGAAGQDVTRKVDVRQPGVGGHHIVIGHRARQRKNHIGHLRANQLQEGSRAADGDEGIPEAAAL